MILQPTAPKYLIYFERFTDASRCTFNLIGHRRLKTMRQCPGLYHGRVSKTVPKSSYVGVTHLVLVLGAYICHNYGVLAYEIASRLFRSFPRRASLNNVDQNWISEWVAPSARQRKS